MRRHIAVMGLPLQAAALTLGIGFGGVLQAQPLSEVLAAEPRDVPVALTADRVIYDEVRRTLTAEGDVEVYYGARTLTAEKIVYFADDDRIEATGPLALRDGEGSMLLADYAEVASDLNDGLISGARALIADGAGVMSAVEGRRVDGRYTVLSRAAYSSCEVCPEKPTPLWSIRARRVLHDAETRDVHYEDAVFEVAGVPIAWLPYFRHPDPSVERRSGVLAPTFRRSGTYGMAIKLPYFWAIDPSRDATLTAFPTERDGAILEGEYRQRFETGLLNVQGSVGYVDLGRAGNAALRGHVFATGRFALENETLGPGAEWGFDLNFSADDGYLRRYGFSNRDRLMSEAFVENWQADTRFSLAAVYFQSLRDGESAGSMPFALPEFEVGRTFAAPDLLGGRFDLTGSGLALTRDDGADISRLTGALDWSREEVIGDLIAARVFGGVRLDTYHIADSADTPDGFATRFTPMAGLEAKLPLVRQDRSGATHLLEPGAQFVVSPSDDQRDRIPNEDSLLVEFDETNIFSVNRFPGFDRIEGGARMNIGLRYARIADDPLRVDAAVGKVFRFSEESSFSPETGLENRSSDTVMSWTLGWGEDYSLGHRLRLGDDFTFARNEIAAQARLGPATVTGGYVYLAKDDTAGALRDREEVSLGLTLDVTDNWSLLGFGRRDLDESRFVEVSTGLRFRNECAELEFFVERDFTSSRDAPPSTDFGLRVRLFGGGDGAAGRSGVCGRLE
ncbi:MAG: LPS-assembly protein LptD [Rubrimonas sp.]